MEGLAPEELRQCPNEQQSGKMWSGRFREPLDPEFEAWQRSIVFDWRLLAARSRGQQGPRIALIAAGILTKEKAAELRGRWTPSPPSHTSDAGRRGARSRLRRRHSPFCGVKLVERVGSLGLKLHTGRSRNEQIATDLRLYVRPQIELVIEVSPPGLGR